MAYRMDSYPKVTVLLIALVPVLIIASLFLDGVSRVAAVVALLVLVGALSGTVRAQVEKQRAPKKVT